MMEQQQLSPGTIQQQQDKKKMFLGDKKKSCAFLFSVLQLPGFFLEKKKRDTNNMSIEEWTDGGSLRERGRPLYCCSVAQLAIVFHWASQS